MCVLLHMPYKVLMSFFPASSRLVTNSSDRTLRQFNLPTYPSPSPGREFLEQELEPTRRFNDPINKTAWHAMSYSPDGEWLAGGLSCLSICRRSLTLMVAPDQVLPIQLLTKFIFGISPTKASLQARWMVGGSL